MQTETMAPSISVTGILLISIGVCVSGQQCNFAWHTDGATTPSEFYCHSDGVMTSVAVPQWKFAFN